MCSAQDNAALPALGFPIRASAGHWLFSASPRLIAAVHALRRLLVPRHPPCALTILTVIFYGVRPFRVSPGDTRYIGYCAVFKVREGIAGGGRTRGIWDPPSEAPAASRSLKTQQHAGRHGRASSPSVGPPGPVDISSGRPPRGGAAQLLGAGPASLRTIGALGERAP